MPLMSAGELTHISEKLSQSRILHDYEHAFSEATGLPLIFHGAGRKRPAVRGSKHSNPFCEQMAETEAGCRLCVEMQEKITAHGGSTETRTSVCIAGLADSAVPVRIGEKVLGYLETGQVALRKLTRADFRRVTHWLRTGGAVTDWETLEKAFFETPAMSRKQYDAMLHLLEVFAQHLALAAEQIATQQTHSEPPLVQRGRQFIEENQGRDIGLEDVARAVNASTFHFCKMFKRATGMTFTEYLALLRVGKAKKLLVNPQFRISEVAYEVGFTSLTHFNRMFRRVTGQSPTVFRQKLSGAET